MPHIRIDPTPRRLRARLGPHTVADSIRAKLVYVEHQHPEYFIPQDDLDWSILASECAASGTTHLGTHHVVRDKDGTAVGQRFTDGIASGLVHLEFHAFDAWFEEDEQIWFHPRDPYRRVDIIESSRHVDVTVNGVQVASSDRPRLVTETGLPVRWYIPRADADWSVLRPSDTESRCQYKGRADWWDVTLPGEDALVDVVWGYERPVADASKLAGLIAFYDEHDAVRTTIDGAVLATPAFGTTMFNPSLHITNINV